jgi:hypothetical protein
MLFLKIGLDVRYKVYPVDLFRLLYRLGVDDDCPIRLSADKALGFEPPPRVMSSTKSSEE